MPLLTLSFASLEEAGSVGPPFDVMTMDRSGKMEAWTQDPKVNCEDFTKGMEPEALFNPSPLEVTPLGFQAFPIRPSFA